MKNTTIVALTSVAVIAFTILIPANASVYLVLGAVGSALGIIGFIRSNSPQPDKKRKQKSRRFKMEIKIQF